MMMMMMFVGEERKSRIFLWWMFSQSLDASDPVSWTQTRGRSVVVP